MVLTTEQLKEMGACKAGIRKFRQLFGDEMSVTIANVSKLAKWGTKGTENDPPIRIHRAVYDSCQLVYWFVSIFRSTSESGSRGYFTKKTSEINDVYMTVYKGGEFENKIPNDKECEKIARIAIPAIKRAKRERLI